MQLETLLEKLKMDHLENQLDAVCEQAAQQELDYKAFLAQALQTEWQGRYQRGIETRLRQARLPWVKTLELLNARCVTKLGRGQIPTAESSVMKIALARIVSKGTELGLHLLGPEGLLRPGTWQQQWLFQPAFHLAGGTDEVQKTLAAERVLGLPQEPGTVDPDTPFDELPRS